MRLSHEKNPIFNDRLKNDEPTKREKGPGDRTLKVAIVRFFRKWEGLGIGLRERLTTPLYQQRRQRGQASMNLF